jgi:hypothetical protein|tara:strand:+ start:5933 stop:6694 length:762 start_codon:yes stop_codon:yes gene_type:complete
MNILLKKPYFKKKAYISESISELNIDLYDIKINDYYKISNKSNALKLNIYINNNDINNFKLIDDNTFNILCENNSSWFDNNLNNEELKNIFNYSFCYQTNTIEAVLSNKSNIYLNNENIDLNKNILNLFKNNKYLITIKLKHIGFYIFKENLQNKWLIKEIYISDCNNLDDNYYNKNEIQEEWTNTLNETITNLKTTIINYNNKINKINNFIDINTNLLKEIKEINNNDKLWDNKINILKNNIKNILSINDNR